MRTTSIYLIFIVLLSSSISCNQINEMELSVNSGHLDYLYEEINVNGIEMAFIHIYSNYPEYKYIDDEDEGTGCVDDAARAAIFYIEKYRQTNDIQYLKKNKKLLRFLIYVQADNGFFYNFIWNDYSINKEYKTSVAEPNWWSWRALWALSESYQIYREFDPEFSIAIWQSIEKLIIPLKQSIPKNFNTEKIAGFDIPSWLPNKYASDQASVLLLGLVNYYYLTNDKIIYDYIGYLSDGIIKMQINDITNPYFGAFLSWQNSWHAYGNSQAYALMKSYRVLKDDRILQSALMELNNFYPELLKKGFLSSFDVSKINGETKIVSENKFSQIAYNIRPMIYSLIEAAQITGDDKYGNLAGEIGQWFLGNNPAKTIMYDEKTGIIFDGIESEKLINMNSGAESTIEGLLSLLKIKRYNSAKKALNIE